MSFGPGPAAARASCPASRRTATSPATRSASCFFTASTVRGPRQGSIKALKGDSVSSGPAMSSEYIFTMYRVDKFYGPDRQVLANISLSFFPGAKIGVLGPNGAGKSTVLRIMAGKEEPSSGTAELSPGATVGLLEQEPELDETRTVRENVEDGVRELRYFLDNVAGWILELDRGRGIPYQGNYSGWLEQKQARLAVEEKQASARQRTLQRELEWVRMAPKARHAKSKARLGAYERLLAEEDAVRLDRVEIHIPPGPRLGDVVIEANGVSKGFGDRLLVEDLTFSLPPAGIVGVIGPNGAGKTTLFRMIAGDETPDTGELRLGDTVQLGYVDQSRGDLDPKNTVWKEISGGQDIVLLGKKEINSRQYTSWFNFRGGDQQKPVGQLSGGERNRVHLAKLLRSGGNVLLLDEPTNDLDVDTLRALEEALLDFAGCAVVISHDRWFLDRVATHILAFEGESQVT